MCMLQFEIIASHNQTTSVLFLREHVSTCRQLSSDMTFIMDTRTYVCQKYLGKLTVGCSSVQYTFLLIFILFNIVDYLLLLFSVVDL